MSFPIVGIGASAGGLESFSDLIAGVPANTGMAYIFVLHLDPGRRSHLANILSKQATLPVEEALESVKILPDHLYVITPNTTLTISGDVLHSTKRDPVERPHRGRPGSCMIGDAAVHHSAPATSAKSASKVLRSWIPAE